MAREIERKFFVRGNAWLNQVIRRTDLRDGLLFHIPWRLPATAIVQTADEKGCDLIVISSHGRTGIDRIVLGSQTARVLAAANVPVLVAR